MSDNCAVCGLPLSIGEWPCITTIRPHAPALPSKGFEPYFDHGLGEYVTGWGDIRKHMRTAPQKLDFRDHPSKAKIEERRERIESQKREARR